MERLACIVLGVLMLIEMGMRKVVGESMWAEAGKRIAEKRRAK